MAKAFRIELGDKTEEYTAAQYTWARSTALQIVGGVGFDKVAEQGYRFFLKGVEVDAREFLEACEQRLDDWYAKKCETHKKVRVLYGSSAACYVWKWVRK